MKVIFLEDVSKTARVGQTKVVADGYARNYLLPRRLAVAAGSQAAKEAEKEMQQKVKQRELEVDEMSQLAEKIDGVEITLEAKVGENDKLYGSITGADIAAELTKVAGHEIDKKKIELAEPIRQTGAHSVIVRFIYDVIATVTVNVISDAPVQEVPEKKEKKAEAKAEEAEEGAEAEVEAEAEPAVAEVPVIDEAVEDLAEEIEAEIEEK